MVSSVSLLKMSDIDLRLGSMNNIEYYADIEQQYLEPPEGDFKTADDI